MNGIFDYTLSIILFFCLTNCAYLHSYELNVALLKQSNVHIKKTKAAVVKVTALLKKRERAYTILYRNLKKLHRVLCKRVNM